MILPGALTLLWLATQQPKPAPKVNPVTAPGREVEISVGVVAPDGAIQIAGAMLSGVETYAWIDPSCRLSTSRKEPASMPLAGWRLSGSIIQETDEFTWVNIRWQRVWNQNATLTTTSPRNVQVVARLGERAEIDILPAADVSACSLAGARLTATVSRPQPSSGQPGGGAGRGVPAMAKPASTTDARRDGALLGAELWLVHTLPNGTEESQRQSFRFDAPGTAFVFPNLVIASPRGDVAVRVSGTIGAVLTAGLPASLTLTLNRDVLGTEGPSRKATGGSDKVLPWPKTGQVVAIELPSVMVAADKEVEGHRLALRVRVSITVGREPEERQ